MYELQMLRRTILSGLFVFDESLLTDCILVLKIGFRFFSKKYLPLTEIL
jgi:hypothetical protein